MVKRKVARPRSQRAPRQPLNPWVEVHAQGRNLHIGQFLTFQIIRLAGALKVNVTRRYLAEFGLSVPEWRLLAMTIRFEPARFSELVARSSMDKGQASRTLQMLTKRGLGGRRAPYRRGGRLPGDPDDHRQGAPALRHRPAGRAAQPGAPFASTHAPRAQGSVPGARQAVRIDRAARRDEPSRRPDLTIARLPCSIVVEPPHEEHP